MKKSGKTVIAGIVLGINSLVCAGIVPVSVEKKVELNIDESSFVVPLGKETEITLGGKIHRIKIHMIEQSRFSNAGIFFKFPPYMRVSEDSSDLSVKIWNINGNDTNIMVQKYASTVKTNEIINSLLLQYEKMHGNVSVSDAKLQSNPPIDGKRLSITMGGIGIVQEIFPVNTSDKTTVVILQDSPRNGKSSLEYMKVKKLLEKTLIIKNGASTESIENKNMDTASYPQQ